MADAWKKTTGHTLPASPFPPPNTPPTPPDPPVPPLPPASGASTVVVAGNGYSVTIDFANQSVVLPPGWKYGSNPSLHEELKGAGVSPAIIVDVLKLVGDIKSKQPFNVILADVMAIIADLK